MIADNLKKVNSRIVSVEHDQQVQLIAVSKARSINEIQQAVDAGQIQFGENHLQESLDKIDSLEGKNLIWHFIGPIQSNKTASIAEKFDWVHSIERYKIAKRLSDQRPPKLSQLNVLLQVNIDREKTKSGFFLEDIEEIIPEIKKLPNISLRGFMCIPNPDNSAESFTKMAELISKYPDLNVLSMGMSADLELAIEKGATFVRVGTDILVRENIIDIHKSMRNTNF